MRTVSVPVIKTDKDHKYAVKLIESLWGAKANSDDGAILEVLMILVEVYEAEHFPIEMPDPIEAILFRMDQAGYSRKDLEDLLGKSCASELLNRKRSLTLSMIRKFCHKWKVPAEVLIRDTNSQQSL